MDVIELTRQLGAAIQQDARYLDYVKAKTANEEDQNLNDLIGKLNLLQLSYQTEAQKEDADEAKLAAFDEDFRKLYGEVMLNENMRNYENARQSVDDMMNYIIQILSLCVNGEDPATCEPAPEGGSCTGSCSTCGGCG